MKTVFDSSQCAHIWAQLSQPHGRNPGNSTHFDGAVFYSYATPIAAFVPTKKGSWDNAVALVSAETYSMTTASKHLPAVRRAIRGRYFTVADIGHSGGRRNTARTGPASDPASWRPVHAANLATMAEDYKQGALRLGRLQSWNWTDLAGVLQTLASNWQAPIDDYHSAFKLPAKMRPRLSLEQDAARIWSRCERLNEERAKPGFSAKREAARVARQAAAQRKQDEAAKLRAMDAAEKLRAWQTGQASQFAAFPWSAPRTAPDGSAWLRVMGAIVETSLGASAPLADVQRVLAVADHIRASVPADSPPGVCWTREPGDDRARYTLGHFTLDRIDAKGVKAGCHFISWAELDRVRPDITGERDVGRVLDIAYGRVE